MADQVVTCERCRAAAGAHRTTRSRVPDSAATRRLSGRRTGPTWRPGSSSVLWSPCSAGLHRAAVLTRFAGALSPEEDRLLVSLLGTESGEEEQP